MLQITDEVKQKIEQLLIDAASDMLSSNTINIIRTVNELYNESDSGKASLEVPLKLKVHYSEDSGYAFDCAIEVKKITKITDTRETVCYNPDIPDLPGLEDPAIHNTVVITDEEKDEVLNALDDETIEVPENITENNEEEKGDEPLSMEEDKKKYGAIGEKFIMQNLEQVRLMDYSEIKTDKVDNTKFFTDRHDAITPKSNQLTEMEMVKFELPPLEDIESLVIIGGDSTRPEEKGMKRYLLFRKKDYIKKDVCGELHGDKVRKCVKPMGHDGNHKYQ